MYELGITENRRKGNYGEQRVMWYLRMRGYRLLERGYTYGHKEIDLIMRKGRVIAFVEVKARTDTTTTRPQSAVTKQKRHNIIMAAKAYAVKNGYCEYIMRFDIAEVDLKTGGINYISNAYCAY